MCLSSLFHFKCHPGFFTYFIFYMQYSLYTAYYDYSLLLDKQRWNLRLPKNNNNNNNNNNSSSNNESNKP